MKRISEELSFDKEAELKSYVTQVLISNFCKKIQIEKFHNSWEVKTEWGDNNVQS